MVLLFENALENILIETGQLLIPAAALKLDDDKLEKLFIRVAKKLQNKRPIRENANYVVTSDGIHIKDALSVYALRYKIYDNWDRISPSIKRNLWSFDRNTRVLRSLFNSPFVVSYGREYKMGHVPITDEPQYTMDDEDEIDFYIKASYKKGSFKLTKTHVDGTIPPTEMVEISRLGNTATLSGSMGTGTLDLTTKKVYIYLTDLAEGNITHTYVNKRIACLDLEEHDLAFITWFTADFLNSLGSLKYAATLDPTTGIPFSLQSDTVLERARQLEDNLTEYLKSNSFWWQWGF